MFLFQINHCTKYNVLISDFLKNRYSPNGMTVKVSPPQIPSPLSVNVDHNQRQLIGDPQSRTLPPKLQQQQHYRKPTHDNLHTNQISNHTPRTLQFINSHMHHKTPSPHKDYRGRQPSVQWRGVSEILNSSMATIEDYDEDDTTTSGSYTVDDDDLRSEMTGMDCFV